MRLGKRKLRNLNKKREKEKELQRWATNSQRSCNKMKAVNKFAKITMSQSKSHKECTKIRLILMKTNIVLLKDLITIGNQLISLILKYQVTRLYSQDKVNQELMLK